MTEKTFQVQLMVPCYTIVKAATPYEAAEKAKAEQQDRQKPDIPPSYVSAVQELS